MGWPRYQKLSKHDLRSGQNVRCKKGRLSRGVPLVVTPAEFDGSQGRSRPSEMSAMKSRMSP
jgi:hypothetical protein